MGGEGGTKTRGSSNAGKAKGKDINVSLTVIRHTKLNIQVAIEIDFLEAINGCQKPITYARINKCGTCNGTKMKPGTQEADCGVCEGTGFQTQ